MHTRHALNPNAMKWIGPNIPENNRILILGESHYDDEREVGSPVPLFFTSGVVERYLSHREPDGGSAKWDRFFDRIAASFGYTPDRSKEFLKKSALETTFP